MCGLMSGPAACGDTSISASAANAGRSPAIRPAVAQAVARRRLRRFICYAIVGTAEGGRVDSATSPRSTVLRWDGACEWENRPIFRYRRSLRARLIAAVNWVALAMRWAKCRYLPFVNGLRDPRLASLARRVAILCPDGPLANRRRRRTVPRRWHSDANDGMSG